MVVDRMAKDSAFKEDLVKKFLNVWLYEVNYIEEAINFEIIESERPAQSTEVK